MFIRVTLEISWDNESPIQNFSIKCSNLRKQDETHSDYYVYADHTDPAGRLIDGRPLILDVSSIRAQEEALKCISDCLQHHKQCPPPVDNPLLPLRIIDCESPAHPRLVTVPQDPAAHMRGRYLALSYVWGEPQPYSTNKSNVEAYHVRIDPAYLPQTIRDAIATTHAFGVRYLWVDSLCIIQDSSADKLVQLQQMAKIYSEAYLTIIAASASRAGEGFLQPRSPKTVPDPAFPVWCSPDQQLGAFHLERFDQSLLAADGDPIHSRGWCLQEWFLSIRAMVYTSRTVQYHCQTHFQNIGNSLYASQRFSNSSGRPSLYRLLDPNTTKQSPSAFDILRTWREVLREYTRRRITQPSDKLVAIAGIAERFHALRKSDYYAGLWSDTLMHDLLWSTVAVHKMVGPATERVYQAPSWSWAALDNEINLYDTPWLASTVRQAGAQCTTVLAEEALPFGQITSGQLLLHAPIIRVACKELLDIGSRIVHGNDAVDGDGSNGNSVLTEHIQEPSGGEGRLRYPICASSQDLGLDSAADSPSSIWVFVGTAQLDYDNASRLHDLWAVPLTWSTTTDALSPEDAKGVAAMNFLDMFPHYGRKMWAEGLILTHNGVDHKGQTQYRRVGRWSIEFDPQEEDIMWGRPTWIDQAAKASIIVV